VNASEETLIDAPARRTIRCELGTTLLVEAAAGTGKTSELVARLVNVILNGRGRLASIAALTFTERAAGEMKLRIRTELDRALSFAEPACDRARAALGELETAKIGTIHAFCAALLREHPVEAGVDPCFEVAESERQRALFSQVFASWFERTLQAPPEGVRRVLARRIANLSGQSPRDALLQAASLMIETRDFDCAYRRDPFDRAAALEAARAELHALAALASDGRAGDPLQTALRTLADELARAESFDFDALEELFRQLLRNYNIWSERTGRGEMYSVSLARSDVLERRTRARSVLEACVRACGADLAACLSRELLPLVDDYAAAKSREGLLDFFDLLLLTRGLLQSSHRLRSELQDNFTHVFVDEFQDTDPVQAEIVLLLCADSPLACDPWHSRPAPGKLFLVGDPKQSIYRFRRADIAFYEQVKSQLMAAGAQLVQLSTSFRSLPGIQASVNAAFSAAMNGAAEHGQASYVALSAFRSARPHQPTLIALPAPRPYGWRSRITNGAINASLPGAVAGFIDWLLRRSGYVVTEQGVDVPIEARHVCLLFRRFRGYSGDLTRDYLRALEARRVPHVLSGGRSYYTREEVIAIRNTLTAIEWPDDMLHVYATLRGPLVAFSDETLFTFRAQVGHLHPFGPVDMTALTEAEQPVALVLAQLATLHRARNEQPIAQTLSLWLDFLRAHAGIAIWPAGEQALGNVLRLLDFARAYERRGAASSFRGFVEWLEEQAQSAQTPDAPVIEESSDGVRIMTVHAAKGLEFPVVVLCDPTAPKRPEYPSRAIDSARKLWAQSLCDVEPVELWEARERVRDHDAAELVRLAYVAATRAKDLLVVTACSEAPIDGWLDVLAPALYPVAERARVPEATSFQLPAFGDDCVVDRADHVPATSIAPGEHIPQRGEHRVVWWDPQLLELERSAAVGVTQKDLLREDAVGHADNASRLAHATWQTARAQTLLHAARPSLVSQTITERSAAPSAHETLVEIIDARASKLARPSGARFGTLVHQLFEHLDFSAQGRDLAGLAQTLGRSLGASALEIDSAVGSVASALAHPFFERVRAAAVRGSLQREAAIAWRDANGDFLDGVVDLCFSETDHDANARTIVVDFKTDAELGELARYAKQLALYAQALQLARGLPATALLLRV
jgi:ATP-dependent helicase/nuclease subunit A